MITAQFQHNRSGNQQQQQVELHLARVEQAADSREVILGRIHRGCSAGWGLGFSRAAQRVDGHGDGVNQYAYIVPVQGSYRYKISLSAS